MEVISWAILSRCSASAAGFAQRHGEFLFVVVAADHDFRLGGDVMGGKPELHLIRQTSGDFFASGKARELAGQLGMRPIGVLMMTHMVDPSKLVEQAKIMEASGAELVYMMDSAGAMLPPDVVARVDALKSALNIQVGFHAHNNLSMAIANTLAATVDTDLETICSEPRREKSQGHTAGLDLPSSGLFDRRRHTAPGGSLDPWKMNHTHGRNEKHDDDGDNERPAANFHPTILPAHFPPEPCPAS